MNGEKSSWGFDASITGASSAIANFDDGGHIWNPLDVFVFTAATEQGRDFWLRDDTTGGQFPLGLTDGWQPLHAEPPLNGTFNLKLYAGRMGDMFSVWGSSLSGGSAGRWQ